MEVCPKYALACSVCMQRVCSEVQCLCSAGLHPTKHSGDRSARGGGGRSSPLIANFIYVLISFGWLGGGRRCTAPPLVLLFVLMPCVLARQTAETFAQNFVKKYRQFFGDFLMFLGFVWITPPFHQTRPSPATLAGSNFPPAAIHFNEIRNF